MYLHFRFGLVLLSILLFLSCHYQSGSKALVSYQELMETLQQPTGNINYKQAKDLLDKIVETSNNLPLQKIIIEGEEQLLSPEKGNLLVAIIESDLANKHLVYLYTKAKFNNTYLKDKNLESVDLENIVLASSYLVNITLTSTNFSHAILTNTSLVDSKIIDSKFHNANCKSVHFLNTTLDNVNFKSGYLRNALFTRSIASEIGLEDAITSGMEGLEEAKKNVQLSEL